MLTKVLKRDGTTEEFQPFKIEDAIKKAFKSEGVTYDESIFKEILKRIEKKRVAAVEDFQDMIEQELYKSRYFDVMRSFILYRHTHKMQREHIYGLNEDTTYVNSSQTIEEYIGKSDWRIKANSNTGYSNAGLVNNTAGKVIANYWLDKIYSKEEGLAHRNGDYHIHDLDCLTAYCAGWSLRVLLDEGFNGVRGRVVNRAGKALIATFGASFLSGIAQATKPTAINSYDSTGSDTTRFQTPNMTDVTASATMNGVAGGSDRLAKYFIAIAEAQWPVIEVSPGTPITFMLEKGMALPVND